jgi:transcriptional regulator with XRE-family HTH domain
MANDSLTIYGQLGKRIAYLRKEKKLSQLELSLPPISPKTIFRISRMDGGILPLAILNRLAKALGIPLEELFRGWSSWISFSKKFGANSF